MSISSVYSNSGTFATADIITATMKNSLNNIHVIDDTSVVAVNTTNAQVYTNSGSGYVSQITHASTSDVVGFSKEFILGTNLYIYNTTQPVSNTRWNTGTDTKYSVSLGSLGSITNNTFSNNIGVIDALNEIRTAILGLSISGLSVSLPTYVSDINPDTSVIDFSGYGIIINTGSSTNENTSFSINDVYGDGSNIIYNYEFETDGAGTSQSTTISLTEPDGTGTYTLSIAADATDDNQSNSIGTDLIALVNNNVESPNNYTATYDTSSKKITFTSVSTFDSVASELWTATVNNNSVSGVNEGNIIFGTSTMTRTGILGSSYTITAPNLFTKTVNGLPLFSKVTFTGGTETAFSDNINATAAALEFKNALNTSLNGFMTATIDSGDSKIVNYTTSIQDDIGLNLVFSNASINKTITQGILGTTQTNINNAGKTNIQVFKPGNVSSDYNKNFVGFVPTLTGAINTPADIISNINTTITDWTIEKDQPVNNQIRFTSVDSQYVNNVYKLNVTNTTATGTTTGDFSTGLGNATITTIGSSVPDYYGLRSVTLANKDVFSSTPTDYSWFETTKNNLNTIFPGYKVDALKTPEFAFDGITGTTPRLVDGFFAIGANAGGQYVIDTDAVTLTEIANIPVDTTTNTIFGSEIIYFSTKLYLAYRVNNDSEITALSLGGSNSGATIYTNNGTTYSIVDSNNAVLIANYIYKWNGTAWVKET